MPSLPSFLIISSLTTITITFIASYIVANFQSHKLQYAVSYISATIDYAPARSIGSLGITMCIPAFMAIGLIRYLYIRSLLTTTSHVHHVRLMSWNDRMIPVGAMACFGALGVAAFQYHVDHMTHLIFAFIFFSCALLYTLVHTYITHHMEWNPISHEPLLSQHIISRVSARVYYTRIICCMIGMISFIWVCMIGPLMQVIHVLPGGLNENSDTTPSTSESLTIQFSAACEIMVFITFAIHVMTYIPTFRHLDVDVIVTRCDEIRRTSVSEVVTVPGALQIDA